MLLFFQLIEYFTYIWGFGLQQCISSIYFCQVLLYIYLIAKQSIQSICPHTEILFIPRYEVEFWQFMFTDNTQGIVHAAALFREKKKH